MKEKRGARIHAQIGEARRHGGLLQIARQMNFERHLLRFGQRAQIAREFAEGRPAIARLDGGHGGTQLRRDR